MGDTADNGRHLSPNTLAGLLAILLWSTTVALARRISEGLGPLTGGMAVYLTASAVLASVLLAKERSFAPLRRLPPRYVLGCGTLFVTYALSLYLALGLAADRSQTIEVGLLNYLWPALTILFSLWLLGHRASGWLIPGTALALAGVVLVLTQGAGLSWPILAANVLRNPLAYALGLAAAVSWGLYSNLARRWGSASGEGGVLLFALATGVAFAALRPLRPELSVVDLRVVGEVAFFGSATALAYSLWDRGMRRGNVLVLAACSYLTPFFSTLVSSAYLRVAPPTSVWAGCALIIAGSLLSWRSVRLT